MILNVKPITTFKGTINLPASKSYSIRAFFIAACGGKSKIIGASDCDDAIVAQSIAKALKQKKRIFNVGESGTSLRFLLPLLSLHTDHATVKGRGTLIGRPNHPLCASLRLQGMDIKGVGGKESIPIVYKGGQLKGGVVHIDGSISSQFISALLITAPRLTMDMRIIIDGKQVVSSDYIIMTRQILKKAGIECKVLGMREILIKGNQQFKGLTDFTVPSDYGLAAFPMAAAALLKSNVELKGHFDDTMLQSDGHIFKFMQRMGVNFKKTSKAITVRGPVKLKGGMFSLRSCPDLVPIMSVMALFASSRTSLVDIGHARVKESDRISDLRHELLKIGAKVSETEDNLIIDPLEKYQSGQILDPHNDHRLAMAFTVLGLKIGCRVKDISCTNKSYPRFVKDMKTLGM